MSRELPEWIGKSDDQKVPPHVRARVFDRHHGICHISKRKIMAGEKWELEHVRALILGGSHRESNLAPAPGRSAQGEDGRRDEGQGQDRPHPSQAPRPVAQGSEDPVARVRQAEVSGMSRAFWIGLAGIAAACGAIAGVIVFVVGNT